MRQDDPRSEPRSTVDGVSGDHRADQATVRRNNLSLVLRRLREAGPRSRSVIADETGLNRATVSSLVSELIARGLVREGGVERTGSVGRPSQPIELDGRDVVGVGLDINVEYVTVVALNLKGETVFERRVSLDLSRLGRHRVLDVLTDLTQEALGVVAERDGRTAGVTVAVPGLVDDRRGVVALAPNLGWRDLPLIEGLSERLGHPAFRILLENDANLAALGEYITGDVGVEDLVYLTGAVGIGLGIISQGRLLRGADGFSGEVGHLQLDAGGHRCGCGRRGCWETMVGFDALLREAADRDDPVRDRTLDLEERIAEIDDRAAAGDERTLAALAYVAERLQFGVSILVNLFNPRAVVLGGYLAALGPYLLGPLEEELDGSVLAPGSAGVRIVLSKLGFTAAARGGAQRALDNVRADPSIVPMHRSSAVHGA
jgi:predicted NBD/HSP70 family sugar kinase